MMEVLLVGEVGLFEVGVLPVPVLCDFGVRLDFEHVLVVEDVFLGLAQRRVLIQSYAHNIIVSFSQRKASHYVFMAATKLVTIVHYQKILLTIS
jgi:hypothetical protein